jgi:hypothetical protein
VSDEPVAEAEEVQDGTEEPVEEPEEVAPVEVASEQADTD